MARKQIINPYIRFDGRAVKPPGSKAQGPYMNRVSNGAHGRSFSPRETACFRVVSAIIGDPNPEEIEICFNEAHELCSSLTMWDFYSNGTPLTDTSFISGTANCITFRATQIIAGDGPSNTDTITMDYTAGTCKKVGDPDPECALESFTGYRVTNRILGIAAAEIGNIRDDIVEVTLTADAATVGTEWTAEINSTPVNITFSEVVLGKIQLTLQTTPSGGDTVTVSHTDVAGGATSTDGRTLYQFADYPVSEVSAGDYLLLESGDRILLEDSSGALLLEL